MAICQIKTQQIAQYDEHIVINIWFEFNCPNWRVITHCVRLSTFILHNARRHAKSIIDFFPYHLYWLSIFWPILGIITIAIWLFLLHWHGEEKEEEILELHFRLTYPSIKLGSRKKHGISWVNIRLTFVFFYCFAFVFQVDKGQKIINLGFVAWMTKLFT